MPNQGGTHEQHVKAGQQSHKNDGAKTQQAQSSRSNDEQRRGGKGNFAEDRQRASEAGKH